AMLEVPAFALALLSIWMLLRYFHFLNHGWLVGSGLLMAAALQTKLTTALVIPAALIEILIRVCKLRRQTMKSSLKVVFQWLAYCALMYLLMLVALKVDIFTFIKSHASSSTGMAFSGQEYKFSFKELVQTCP